LQEDFFKGGQIDDVFIFAIDLGEAVIAEFIDDSGNVFGLLEDFGDDLVGKDGIVSAGYGQMMQDISFCFTVIQSGKMIMAVNTLRERFHGVKLKGSFDLGLRKASNILAIDKMEYFCKIFGAVELHSTTEDGKMTMLLSFSYNSGAFDFRLNILFGG